MAIAMIAAWAGAALGEFDWKGTTGVLAYVAFFFVPIVLALGLSLARYEAASRERRRSTATLAVQDGLLKLRAQAPLHRSERSFPLHECLWYTGSARDDSCADAQGLSAPDAVIVVLPPHEAIWPDRQKVACGWTPETRHLWTGFLTLARVPRRP